MISFSFLSVLVCASAVLAPPQSPALHAGGTDEARVRLVAGRGQLTAGGGSARPLRRGQDQRVPGAGYLELAPLSTLEVSWPGAASLRADGPAILEWRAPGPEGTPPRLGLHSFMGGIEIEVRRGRPTVVVPQGWTIELERGALGLRELSNGGVEIRQHGGSPARVRSEAYRPDLGNRSFPLPEGRPVRLAPAPWGYEPRPLGTIAHGLGSVEIAGSRAGAPPISVDDLVPRGSPASRKEPFTPLLRPQDGRTLRRR